MMKCKQCGKKYKTGFDLGNHVRWTHKRNEHLVECKYCHKLKQSANLEQHEKSCFENPKNEKHCLYCDARINRFKKFCNSQHAALYNTEHGLTGYKMMIENGTHPTYKKKRDTEEFYREICFKNWDRICAIEGCGWTISLDVHHADGNKKNVDKRNLIPLCKNHHALTIMNEYRDNINKKIKVAVDKKFGAMV